ncbi:hypothetical protein [Rhizobium sp. CF142]|uniref:hypothetical protein n=1 Tax=Rhizobium sp. CF142 TaxID=1144314 RepID=UPI00026EEDB0|nr:hypothetical protein [Rhizobium sp. CF142]EJJ27737.1 hypothetical protein PMI11_03920 [Rhizobium sp. CF142]
MNDITYISNQSAKRDHATTCLNGFAEDVSGTKNGAPSKYGYLHLAHAQRPFSVIRQPGHNRGTPVRRIDGHRLSG